MPTKGIIPKNVIPGNVYTLLVANTELTATVVGELDETLQMIELPDGTAVSGGRTEVTESTLTFAQHMADEIDFMDAWWELCKDPVSPNAYKSITITGNSNDGTRSKTSTCTGVFIKGRKGPEYNLEDGGTVMTQVEYSISIDEIDHS